MIISKSPLRITLGGGGTDLPAWYKKHGCFLFAMAINKFVYVTISKRFNDNKIWLSYSNTEAVNNINLIKNNYIKSCLSKIKNVKGIEIHSISDVPGNSGLGSSGAFLVSLNHALYKYYNISFDKKKIAEESCHIESEVLKKNTGKQDQYMATYGGLRTLEIDKKGNTSIKLIKINSNIIENLEDNTLLYFSGVYRSASNILQKQQKNIQEQSSTVDYMHMIQEIGYKSFEAIKQGNLDTFGMLLNDHHNIKKKLSSLMSNNKLDKIYSTAMDYGALGGKNIGAGGGGVFMFYVPKNQQIKFRIKMKKIGILEMNWKFNPLGSLTHDID